MIGLWVTYANPEKHLELVDAVNDAKTKEEKRLAEARLDGWREGVSDCGMRWSSASADLHSMKRFGEDTDMCCGVLLRDPEGGLE